jgi:hypothetical protein
MKNTPNCISGGTVTRDPDGIARGGGFDRGVPESAQNWLFSNKFCTVRLPGWLNALFFQC